MVGSILELPKIKRIIPIFLVMVAAAACQPASQPASMKLISYGQTVSGKLDGQEDRWLFIAGPQDTITVDLSSDSGTPNARILDANSNIIDQLAVKEDQQVQLPSAGQYSIA